MRAFALDTFGAAGSIQDLELPEPGEGEVRLKVAAASVNPVDWKAGKGYIKDYLEHRFPFIPGQDACGVVDAVGSGVNDLTVGDVVFGYHGKSFMGGGTFAEYAIASPLTLCPKPQSLDHAEAAALALSGVTAMICVEAVAPAPGQVVLVVGAAGGVGSYVTQMVAARGAIVVGVARAINHEYVRRLAAAETIDYTTTDVAGAVRAAYPDGIDALIDLASDPATVRALMGLVRDGGVVVSADPTVPLDDPRVKGVLAIADPTRARLQQLATWAEDGTLRLPEIRRFGFDQVGDALAESEARHVRGKLVVATASG